MPTTVHIPGPILDEVDRRARKLNLSRNRLILRALERELERPVGWSDGFFERLAEVEHDDETAVEEMVAAIRAGRTSKEPRTL